MKKNVYTFPLILLIVMISILPACGRLGQGKIDQPLNWQVEDFSFMDQDGSKLGLKELKGKVWLVDFIFTNCTTVCSPMTAHMASLQKKLKQQGVDVTFVSFSVDPQRDTPVVLKDFGKKFNVDFSNWHFMTGYSQDQMTQFALGSFKSAVMIEPDSDQVMHATSFFLVDSAGLIVKRYDGTDEKADQQLLKDIRVLLKK